MSHKRLLDSRRTPIDASYPTSLRTDAQLRIYSTEMQPSELTTHLGLQPSDSGVLESSPAHLPDGRERKPRDAYWSLSSRSARAVDSLDLRDHLDWLLAQLNDKSASLRALQEDDHITMCVHCVFWSAGEGGPTLWPEQMQGLAAMNLECTFNFSVFADDD